MVLGQKQAKPRPRPLAYNRTEAAEALGVSVDFFDDHVAIELPCVRRGRLRLYPVSELERWVARSAEWTYTAGLALVAPFDAHVHVADVLVAALIWVWPWA